MTERVPSQVQASKLRFLRRFEGVTLFNKVCSSKIRKSLNIEALRHRIEKSQLRWFGHVSRMSQEKLPKLALIAKANDRRPVERPKTRWTNYVDNVGWNRQGLKPKRNDGCDKDREVSRLNIELLLSGALTEKQAMKKEEESQSLQLRPVFLLRKKFMQ